MVVIEKSKNFVVKGGSFVSSLEKLKTGEEIKLWKKKHSSKLRGLNSVKVIRELRSGK